MKEKRKNKKKKRKRRRRLLLLLILMIMLIRKRSMRKALNIGGRDQKKQDIDDGAGDNDDVGDKYDADYQ